MFITLFLLSCTAVTKQQESRPGNGSRGVNSEQLLAENRMMKKRLSLIEREDDVLKKENRQHRIRVQELEAQNRELGQELDIMKEKHAIEMLISEEQSSALKTTLEKVKNEASERMYTLIAENKALAEQIARERRFFNDQINTVKAAANEQREEIIQAKTQRELALAAELDALSKKLEAKQKEILLLKSVGAEQHGSTSEQDEVRTLTRTSISVPAAAEATH
ncbi:MAG: hypothetical protein RBR02_09165 [Desulfuromonadaceae bacterium]|nr:hypothetical protein [Desulfuromonadaceae bacterium]